MPDIARHVMACRSTQEMRVQSACWLSVTRRAISARPSPKVNAVWDGAAGVAVQSPSVDIAIAVSTDYGLMTPIVTGADRKSLTAIGAQVRELVGPPRYCTIACHVIDTRNQPSLPE